MELNWNLVLEELQFLSKNINANLVGLSSLTTDTLYGSMYGLNYRYQSLSDLFLDSVKRKNIIQYSITRITALIGSDPFTYKKRKTPRAKVGVGTYRWKYNEEIISTAIEIGVPLIDTAEGYGYGKVEKELGKVLQKYPNVNVFTKVRRDHMSPTAIGKAVQRSIDNLNVKPHVQLHFPNNIYPDAILFLAGMLNRGSIKSIGLGNCSIDMIEYSQTIVTHKFGVVINSVQVPFSLLDFRIKNGFIEYCNERGIMIIAYSPLGQEFTQLNSDFLKSIAKKYDATSAQMALAWVLHHRGVIPIPQTNNIEHLKQNIAANDLYLDEEDVLGLQEYYTKNKTNNPV